MNAEIYSNFEEFVMIWLYYLGGGFKYFFFHPYLGKIPILINIFQMGWNHQLAI